MRPVEPFGSSFHPNWRESGVQLTEKQAVLLMHDIYIYADRNVRPCMIQGYTLTTFPKVAQYILCTTREETGKRTLHLENQDSQGT